MAKSKTTSLTLKDVKHLSILANLPLTHQEHEALVPQLTETLSVVDQLNELDTASTSTTSQVTGLVNVFRQDQVDPSRVLTQHQALQNAAKTHQGYFVVPQLINHEA